jgi:ribosome-binding ATPase YchF (GTP1/OBG family)
MLKAGIVGLPNVGKSILSEDLTNPRGKTFLPQ